MKWSAAALAGALLLAACVLWLALRASLPTLDGAVVRHELSGPVTISRDDLGVATISGRNRLDVAFATGYAHAQDRLFQMDLLRRAGAGELSELLGTRTLPVDRSRRLHRFRARAHATFDALPSSEQELLRRYAAGVNAGYADLQVRPFEYLLLGVAPRPWEPEDSLLVVWAMYFDLQENQAPRAVARRWIKEHCTAAQAAFLLPLATRIDAPLDAPAIDANRAPLPADPPLCLGSDSPDRVNAAGEFALEVGSNNWAVAGTRSNSGSAIVANDMHLQLRIPNIWYRAEVQYPDANGVQRRVAGVTLPGAPLVVVGSNGNVAWGFTNSENRYRELIELQQDPADPLKVSTPAGWEQAREFHERIEVHGADPETLTIRETTLGPIKEIDHRVFADHWVAHGEHAVNIELMGLELAEDVQAAMRVANRVGIPAQNFMVGDKAGHIAWTIAGPLPVQNTDDMSPDALRSTGTQFADKMLDPERYPRIVDPEGGQLWTANSRQLAGAAHALLGDGGLSLGSRTMQVRKRLEALPAHASERDVLEIGLDDRALLVAEWRDRALQVLDDAATRNRPDRAEFKRILLEQWAGTATAESSAYTLARTFFLSVYDEIFGPFDRRLKEIYPGANFDIASRRWPVTVARMLDEAPPGWFPTGRSAREVELAAVDRAIVTLTQGGAALSAARWGDRNRSNIAHPFASISPLLDHFLAAPHEPQSGDLYGPHVTGTGVGQSERMAVAPGHEEQGFLCMPGGQSGHPLSPYFLAGHDAWMSGACSGFLPGPTRHTLSFTAS